MKQLYTICVLLLCGGCIKDFGPLETYKGGTEVRYSRGFLRGGASIINHTEDGMVIKNLEVDPVTKAFKVEYAGVALGAAGPMKAFEGQQANILLHEQLANARADIQRQTWLDTMAAGNQALSTIVEVAPGIIEARAQARAAVLAATPPRPPSVSNIVANTLQTVAPLLFRAAAGQTIAPADAVVALRALGHNPSDEAALMAAAEAEKREAMLPLLFKAAAGQLTSEEAAEALRSLGHDPPQPQMPP